MKRITYFILSAGFVALISCGPSAEEKAAEQKRIQDSAAAAQKAIDDSIMTANAAAEKAMQDSMMAVRERFIADSVEAAQKAKPRSKPKTQEQKKEEDRKSINKEKG